MDLDSRILEITIGTVGEKVYLDLAQYMARTFYYEPVPSSLINLNVVRHTERKQCDVKIYIGHILHHVTTTVNFLNRQYCEGRFIYS